MVASVCSNAHEWAQMHNPVVYMKMHEQPSRLPRHSPHPTPHPAARCRAVPAWRQGECCHSAAACSAATGCRPHPAVAADRMEECIRVPKTTTVPGWPCHSTPTTPVTTFPHSHLQLLMSGLLLAKPCCPAIQLRLHLGRRLERGCTAGAGMAEHSANCSMHKCREAGT